MNRLALAALSGIALFVPLMASALLGTQSTSVLNQAVPLNATPSPTATQSQQARAPQVCEQACSLSAAGNCAPGDVARRNGDVQCAASAIGIPEYTKLSSFGSSGGCIDREDNNVCASGSCTTWEGKPVYGVAHRTFPFGTTMEVCNLNKPGVCQIATVVERGPHSAIGSVTVDARVELAVALLMGCNGTTQASYKVLSVPGVSQTSQPSGPAQAGLDALLAAGHINGNLGNNVGNPNGYTPVQTPYGMGYLGNPTTKPYYAMQPAGGSPYASASPVPASGTTAAGQQIPVSQQLSSSPYSALTTSQSAATNLQTALAQPVASQGQAVVAGAPAVGAIYAQPRRISASGAFSLSWVSLNMKPGSCVVKRDATTLVSANEGTRPVPAQGLAAGTVTFTLSCTAADGSGFSTTDTVAIY